MLVRPTAIGRASVMAAMPTVAEHVKQRTGKKQEPRDKAKGMRPMLREEKESGNREKGDRDETGSRGPKATLPGLSCVVVRVIALLRQMLHVIAHDWRPPATLSSGLSLRTCPAASWPPQQSPWLRSEA